MNIHIPSDQATLCCLITMELERFPGEHYYQVSYDPYVRMIGIQLADMGNKWVPVDGARFYQWLHNTPGLKWRDVVAMLTRKWAQLKKQKLNQQQPIEHQ